MHEMNKFADVSVIISHYNRTNFLKQAVLSAIQQTIKPKEIIVVDDCSRLDQQIKVEKICKHFGVNLVLRKTNGGPSAARNDGIKVSTGEWIQILDADDFLTHNSLEVRLDALSRNPRALWIAGQMAKIWWFVTPQSLKSRFLQKIPLFKARQELVIEPHNVPLEDPFKIRWHHGAILFHRSLFQKYGLYDEMIRRGEDKELRWRFFYFSQTVPLVVPDIVYIYRQGHGGRLTSLPPNHKLILSRIENRKSQGLKSENTEFLK